MPLVEMPLAKETSIYYTHIHVLLFEPAQQFGTQQRTILTEIHMQVIVSHHITAGIHFNHPRQQRKVFVFLEAALHNVLKLIGTQYNV